MPNGCGCVVPWGGWGCQFTADWVYMQLYQSTCTQLIWILLSILQLSFQPINESTCVAHQNWVEAVGPDVGERYSKDEIKRQEVSMYCLTACNVFCQECIRACNSNRSPQSGQDFQPIRTLVTCTHSNINILRTLRCACYYFQYWREILLCCAFYVVTCSYSSRLFLCALDFVQYHFIGL